MPTMQDIIRRITIQASSQGVDQTSASLQKLSVSQETVGKSALSAAGKLDSLQKSLDAEYRSEQKLASIEKTLTAARNEGLITLERQNELLTLAAAKYRVAGESAEFMAEGFAKAKELAVGLVAGLGLTTALVGLAELPEKVAQALEAFDQIGKLAKTTGLSAEDFQALAYAANLGGIATDKFAESMQTFAKNSGLAEVGSGRLVSQLKKLDPELLTQLQTDGSQRQRLDDVADALSKTSDAAKQAAIGVALFGDNGTKMVQILKAGHDELEATAKAARDMGLVVSNELIDNAEVMNDKFETSTKILNLDFKTALVELAPVLVTTAGALVQVAGAIGTVADQFNSISTRTLVVPLENNLTNIENQIASLNADIRSQKAAVDAMPDSVLGVGNPLKALGQSQIAGKQGYLNQLYDTAGQYQDRIDQLQGMGAPKPPALPPPLTPPPDDRAVAEIKRVTDALNLQLKALTETDRQKEIDQQLASAHVTASSKEGQAITDLAGKYYDEKKAIDEARAAATFLADTTEQAFEGIITGSESVSDALANVVKALEQAVLQAALLGSGPLGNIFGGASGTAGVPGGILGNLFSGLGGSGSAGSIGFGSPALNALGGIYSSSDLSAYRNTVVSRPTTFAFASGAGLMGEAGPEAIMPLMRGPDGNLGVRSAGGGSAPIVNLTIVHQPGAEDSATAKTNGNAIDIRAVIGSVAAKDLGTPGHPLNRTMKTMFGGRQQLIRRGA